MAELRSKINGETKILLIIIYDNFAFIPYVIKRERKDIKNTYNGIYILEFIFKVNHLSV